jgi:hypothetical protein
MVQLLVGSEQSIHGIMARLATVNWITRHCWNTSSPSTSAIMGQYVGPDVAFAEDVDSFMARLPTICCLYVSYPYFQVY